MFQSIITLSYDYFAILVLSPKCANRDIVNAISDLNLLASQDKKDNDRDFFLDKFEVYLKCMLNRSISFITKLNFVRKIDK